MQQQYNNRNQVQNTCKFFLKGSCAFGDKCYNFHPQVVKQLLPPQEYKLMLEYPEDFKIDEQEMQRYNIQLAVPFKLRENDTNELIIIRHGLSFYNYASSDFYYKTGYSFSEQPSRDVYQTNPALIDADLHPYGVLMSEQNSKNLHNVNVSIVFVSPLARAIQTAYHLFKSHPNQMNIKFIILPELTEILSKVQDISNLRKQIPKYGKIFDFSLMQETFGDNLDFWQILNLHDEEERINIFSRFEYENNNGGDNFYSIEDVLLKMMNEKFPSAIEKTSHIYQRTLKARQIIQEYVLNNKVDTTKSKIVIVSHNAFIQNFTASGIQEDGFVLKGDSLINCEMRSSPLYI